MNEHSDLPQDIKAETIEKIKGAQIAADAVIKVVVENDEGLKSAGDDLIQIKRYQKEVKTLKKGSTDPLNQRKAAVLKWFRPIEEYLETAERTLKRVIYDYQDKCAQEAKEKALAEARRLERLAERKAARAEKKGDDLKAEEIKIEADRQVAMTIASASTESPKIKGISTRSTYKAEVTDMVAFVEAVAKGHIPMRYLEVNYTELNKLARALKNDLDYPGVIVHEIKSVAART